MSDTPLIIVLDDDLSGPMCSERSMDTSIAKPPCECADCQEGFYTVERQCRPELFYRHRLSDADAKYRALSTVKQIHDQRDALRATLDIFADVLMSRWKKLSQTKREALLKEAAPGLEEEQWIIPRYGYLRERLYFHKRSLKRRRQLLLPWLNVQVLKTNPIVLFALMHCRTAYPPQSWAAFDTRQLNLSWPLGYFDVDFSRKCAVMYGDKYGSLVDWEEKAAHRGDTLGLPRAMLVFEAQACLMEILNNIAVKILDGVDNSQPPRTNNWKTLVDNNAFKGTSVVELWSPYTNPAFSPPPAFDIKYLLALAKSRRDATADHIWHLQCDAAYMRRHLKILLAMELSKKLSEENRGLHIVQNIRIEVRNHHMWQWIEMECRNVDEARDKCRDNIQHGAALPTHYDRALGALELYLVNQVIDKTVRLEQLLPYAPGLQQHWSVEIDPKRSVNGVIVRSKTVPNTQDNLTNDPLYWCLVQLLAWPDVQGLPFDHSMLFAMIEEHFAKNPRERTRLDEVFYQLLSDLAVCHEMLLAVRSHRPRNKNGSLDEVCRTEKRRPAWRRLEFGTFRDGPPGKKELPTSIADRPQDDQCFRQAESNGFTHKRTLGVRIGTSFLKNFYQVKPPTGVKNTAWLERQRELRTHLEKFWQSIRVTIRRDFEASDLTATEVNELMKVLSASLSEGYAQEKQQEEDAIIAASESEEAQPWQKFTESGLPAEPIAPRPEKAKTRGQPVSVNNNGPAPAGEEKKLNETHDVVEASPIKVTKHSLDVFQLMFPGKGDAAKDVLWDRFIHAMADAGFVARNTGGSLVSFKKQDGEGRIVFHRPHPDPKIDPIMLQAMGKRMAKWFGWKRSRFELRDESREC